MTECTKVEREHTLEIPKVSCIYISACSRLMHNGKHTRRLAVIMASVVYFVMLRSGENFAVCKTPDK